MKIKLIILMLCCSAFAWNKAQANYGDEVFARILLAVNRDLPTPPHLVWVSNMNGVASTYANGTIEVDSRLLERMRGFGADSANALAHILAHEVMHYYMEHFWAGEFALPYGDASWGQELQGIDSDTLQLQYQETQADLYAIFYATSAGYQTGRIADAVIDSIYRWYNLPFKMKRYPSLDARKEIARTAARDVAALLPMYEAGKMMLMLGMSASGKEQLTYLRGAAYAFQHITDNNIRTTEMYNNMAVVRIMQAITMLNDTIAAFRWPLVIESGSVLYDAQSTRGAGMELPEEAARLLQEAKNLLESALEMDAAYQPAMTNLCVALMLLGKQGSMADVLDELTELSDNTALELELRGLAAWLKGKHDQAVELLEEADAAGSLTAKRNAEVAAGKLMPVGIDLPVLADISETIDGTLLPDYFSGISALDGSRTDERSQNLLLFCDTIGRYVIFEVKFKFQDRAFRTLKMVKTLPGDLPPHDKGISQRSDVRDLQKQYPEDATILLESDHEVFVFPLSYSLVWISQNGKVDGWGWYWAQ
ncbi:MAG TPA: hypothetical protein DCG24_00655 [Bacteroidetes bacterium]|nr:hypothetical protein [Bacteroidota bacterium]HPR27839.1 hypothetical protein [Chitinophagales bacterium]HQU39755.1 hypothetical protein [Chitinophagales bacterium]